MSSVRKKELVRHEFGPEFDKDSELLILGSIPSPKSRETGFYYGHPRNRFWKTLAAVFDEPKPEDIESKKQFLKRHHIALWDVLECCEICGADDSSITDPVANDIGWLLEQTAVKRIYTTGSRAWQLYETCCFPKTGIHAKKLPSTSPANCAVSQQALVEAYRVLKSDLPAMHPAL